MALIDVGSLPTDRLSAVGIGATTTIDKDNPVNLNGKITEIQIWANTNLADVEVGIFTNEGVNVFSTRSWVALGAVVSGSLQSFPVSLDVVAGDYIGIYGTGGDIEKGNEGVEYHRKAGDQIPCTSVDFGAAVAPRAISLYGTGLTPPAITSLTPNSGPVGQTVVIAGTDFEAAQGAGGVTVGGIAAIIVAWSDTSITIIIPAGVPPGIVPIVVTTAHGQVSIGSNFTVTTGGRRRTLVLPPIGWPIGGQGLGRPLIMG
jgi:hypothetical protein